ncbi:MAG: hypothetical protein WKF96_01230 [Solirubrobacteraceae bacterium]
MSGEQPYDFSQAKAAQREASTRQRAAEQFVIDSWKGYAEAERAYRAALAAKIVELKAGGMAVTACADVARGEPAVAALKHRRDIAEGVREAAGQAAWRASADRKAEQSFLEWSARKDIAETYQPPTHDDPRFAPVSGATHA